MPVSLWSTGQGCLDHCRSPCDDRCIYLFYDDHFSTGTGIAGRTRPNFLIMPIIINLDVMLDRRKTRSNELAERIGLTTVNLSILKTGKVKAIRLESLEAICKVLDCQPGDILEYRKE